MTAAFGQARHHAVIAGTGRAGTTFLVRWLSECGIETDVEATAFSARARAGFEHRLDPDVDLPYLVKDPLLFTYCSRLDLEALVIDALIVPIRALTQAAESRVLQERIGLLEQGRDNRADPATLAASTTGGILYSLEVTDQARLLAVGFHELLHWAVTHEIPLLLLDFPRLVRDRDYTVDRLWPWLSNHCSRERALACFKEVAEPDAVRVEQRAGPADRAKPDDQALARAAAREYIDELRATVEQLRAETLAAESSHRRAEELASALAHEREAAATQREAMLAELSLTQARLASIETSRSWRWLAPLRGARRSLAGRSKARANPPS